VRSWRVGCVVRADASADLHALAVDRQDDALPFAEAGAYFGVAPVAETRLDGALFEPAVHVDQDPMPLEERFSRHAYDVVAPVEDHLDVGAVADQQGARLVRGDEVRFDVHRPRLGFEIEHVGRHPAHTAREVLITEGVERDAHDHVGTDAAGVDLVDRGAHVRAARVDQVDGRRRGDADGGRGDELTQLAVDLRHDAGERGAQACLRKRGLRHRHLRFGHASRLRGGPTTGPQRFALRDGAAHPFHGRDALALQGDLSRGLLLGHVGPHAGLFAAGLGGGVLALGEFEPGLDVVVPQLQQQVAAGDAVALVDGEDVDAPAHRGRDAGALTGLHGAGARIGDGRFHDAAVDGGQTHRHRLGACQPVDERDGGAEGEAESAEGGAAAGHALQLRCRAARAKRFCGVWPACYAERSMVEEARGGGPVARRRSVVHTAAAVVVVIAGLKAAASLVIPILLAALIALICVPPVRRLQAAGVPTLPAVLLVFAVVALVLLLVSAIVGSSVRSFNAALPAYRANLDAVVHDRLAPLLGERFASSERLAEAFDTGGVMQLVGNLTTALLGLVSSTLLILVIAALMLFEASALPAKLRRAMGGPQADISDYEGMARAVFAYMSIKAVLSFATGALATLITWVAGVDFPLLWGLLAFLFNFVPSVGSIIAAIPPILLALLQDGVPTGAGVAAGYLVINVAIGTVLEPRVMGRRLGLSTLVVFLSLVVWGWVLGPVGMLLSVPLTMVVKIVCESREELRFVAILLGPASERDVR
jgi:predicted PurR-regulated permease PerM